MSSSPSPSECLHAYWIWTPENPVGRNQFVYFRKAFTLADNPDAATCSITAERFYQLRINGDWVGQGPALGHPFEKAYDTYDVTNLLRPGTNVIAAIVQYDGAEKTGDTGMDWSEPSAQGGSSRRWAVQGDVETRWYEPPTPGGLWCQLVGQIGGSPLSVISDDTWGVRRAPSWRADSHHLNDLYIQEVYTVGKDPLEWNIASFDDSVWPRAVVDRMTVRHNSRPLSRLAKGGSCHGRVCQQQRRVAGWSVGRMGRSAAR